MRHKFGEKLKPPREAGVSGLCRFRGGGFLPLQAEYAEVGHEAAEDAADDGEQQQVEARAPKSAVPEALPRR